MQGNETENDLFIHLEDLFGTVPGGPRMQQQLLSVNDVNARRIALPVVVHGDENRDNAETGELASLWGDFYRGIFGKILFAICTYF